MPKISRLEIKNCLGISELEIQACDKYGTPYGRANNRLRLGWPDERAILAPKGERLHG